MVSSSTSKNVKEEHEYTSYCIYTSTIFFPQQLYVKQVVYKDFMSVKQ